MRFWRSGPVVTTCVFRTTFGTTNPTLSPFTGVARVALLAVTSGVLLSWGSSDLAAQPNYQVIANLANMGLNTVLGGLVRGADGALYGTVGGGGANLCGAIYRLAADGTVTVLHNFARPDGCSPVGDLALGPDGGLYGTTYVGGDVTVNPMGRGTVFKLAPNGTFTVLHRFTGAAEGAFPYAGLTLAPNGLLYGTTMDGTIFTISPTGDFATISRDIANLPQAALTVGSDGFLYGTTSGLGTASNSGYVFRTSLTGDVTVLHTFPYVPGGTPDRPEGGQLLSEVVEGPDGNFYGTTSIGGPAASDMGTVFRMTPGGTVTTLHAFAADTAGTSPQGFAPWAGLTLGTDGNLYGVATRGGVLRGGTLFRLSLDGAFTLLRSFEEEAGGGSTEDSPLEASPGIFYGTTAHGWIFRLIVNPPTTPQPPTEFYVSSMAGNVVTFRWTPAMLGPAATEYVLEGGVTPGQVLASLSTGSASPIFTLTAPTGAFYVRVHQLTGGTRSGPSNEIRLFVNVPQPPSAPGNLVGFVNGSNLGLAWHNTFAGGQPTGITLEVTGSIVASIPLGVPDAFSFADVPGGTYTFTIRATNAAGTSGPSNAVALSFPGPCSGAPLPSANFLAYRIGNTIRVVWDPAPTGTATTSYVLNVSGAFDGNFPTAGRTLSGAAAPGTYNLRLTSVNACGSATTAVQMVSVP